MSITAHHRKAIQCCEKVMIQKWILKAGKQVNKHEKVLNNRSKNKAIKLI